MKQMLVYAFYLRFDLLLVAVFAGPEGSGSVYQTVKIDNTQYAKELVEPGTRLR